MVCRKLFYKQSKHKTSNSSPLGFFPSAVCMLPCFFFSSLFSAWDNLICNLILLRVNHVFSFLTVCNTDLDGFVSIWVQQSNQGAKTVHVHETLVGSLYLCFVEVQVTCDLKFYSSDSICKRSIPEVGIHLPIWMNQAHWNRSYVFLPSTIVCYSICHYEQCMWRLYTITHLHTVLMRYVDTNRISMLSVHCTVRSSSKICMLCYSSYLLQ